MYTIRICISKIKTVHFESIKQSNNHTLASILPNYGREYSTMKEIVISFMMNELLNSMTIQIDNSVFKSNTSSDAQYNYLRFQLTILLYTGNMDCDCMIVSMYECHKTYNVSF